MNDETITTVAALLVGAFCGGIAMAVYHDIMRSLRTPKKPGPYKEHYNGAPPKPNHPCFRCGVRAQWEWTGYHGLGYICTACGDPELRPEVGKCPPSGDFLITGWQPTVDTATAKVIQQNPPSGGSSVNLPTPPEPVPSRTPQNAARFGEEQAREDASVQPPPGVYPRKGPRLLPDCECPNCGKSSATAWIWDEDFLKWWCRACGSAMEM